MRTARAGLLRSDWPLSSVEFLYIHIFILKILPNWHEILYWMLVFSSLLFFFFWLAATLIDIIEEKWRECFFFFLQVIHSPPPFNCQIWQVANRAAPLPALSQLRNTHYCKISMIRNWSVYKHQVYFSQTVEVKGTPLFFHSGLLHKRGIKLFCPTGWEPVLKDT